MKNIKEILFLIFLGFFGIMFIYGYYKAYNATWPDQINKHLNKKTTLALYSDQYVLRYDCGKEGVPYTYYIDSKEIKPGYSIPEGAAQNVIIEALESVDQETGKELLIPAVPVGTAAGAGAKALAILSKGGAGGRGAGKLVRFGISIAKGGVSAVGWGAGYLSGKSFGRHVGSWNAKRKSVNCNDPAIDPIINDPKHWEGATRDKWKILVGNIKTKLRETKRATEVTGTLSPNLVEQQNLLTDITEGPDAPSSSTLKSQHFKKLFDIQKR
jgi:hypothetical protein